MQKGGAQGALFLGLKNWYYLGESCRFGKEVPTLIARALLSLGVEYTGPEVGVDSIIRVSTCVVFPLNDRSGVFRQVALLSEDASQQDSAQTSGVAPTEMVHKLQEWIRFVRGDGKMPALLILDPIGEQHVRWYFRSFGGEDPFADEEAAAMVARLGQILRDHMAEDRYTGRWAPDIAHDQRDALWRIWPALIRGTGGYS